RLALEELAQVGAGALVVALFHIRGGEAQMVLEALRIFDQALLIESDGIIRLARLHRCLPRLPQPLCLAVVGGIDRGDLAAAARHGDKPDQAHAGPRDMRPLCYRPGKRRDVNQRNRFKMWRTSWDLRWTPARRL